jgi:hypothetical protein
MYEGESFFAVRGLDSKVRVCKIADTLSKTEAADKMTVCARRF